MTNDNETERARSALFTISPDLPHDQWVRVGMAAHAGGLSFDEWDGWSQQGSNYNPTTARDTWKSFKDKPGGVTVATLFKIAREHGWVDRSSSGANQRQAPAVGFAGLIDKPTAPAPEKKASAAAERRLSAATPAPDGHPYLVRKNVHTTDGLMLAGTDLLVPMYDPETNLLTSVQNITPDGRKTNMKGAQKGCFPIGAHPDLMAAEMLICEGVATGISLHEATGISVICAMDVGSLLRTAQAMRRQYPHAKIVICADDDHTRPDNPGLTQATKAAQAVGGFLAVPDFGDYRPDGHKDFNDLHQTRGITLVAELVASAVQPAQPPAPEPRFKLLKDADIDGMPDLEWLIHGILPTKGMGAVFGPSGSGKSFVIVDMACAIAEGRHWFGYRTTKTPIVYIVLEGAQGLKNRRRAWLKHHNRAALPDGIHFIVQPVNFMEEGDVYELAEVLPPGCMTIVDTLNRAAPGADENASKDMGLILAATSAISRATGGLTVLVHHTGKNEDAGLRGHSSLKAALDGSIVVTRNGEARAWKADKSKDGPDGQSHPFKLEVVNLGIDKYGDTISSCVVTPDTSGRQHIKPLTPSQRSAIGTYCAACDEGLGLVSDSFEFLGLHLEAWRKVFYQLSPGDNEDSKRRIFNRTRKELIDNGLATVENDVYRITERTAATREGDFIEKALIKNDSGTNGTKRDKSRTVPVQKPENTGTNGTRLLGVSRCPAGIDPIQAETELGKNGEKSSSFSGADDTDSEQEVF